MRTLTNEMLIANAAKAFDEGLLTAFLGFAVSKTSNCVYRKVVGDKTYGCAIGVSLNDDEISAIQKSGSQSAMVNKLELLEIVEFADIATAASLQEAHDTWAREPDDSSRRERFKKIIGR